LANTQLTLDLDKNSIAFTSCCGAYFLKQKPNSN